MKYWFYSEGNILGPYAPGELLTLPAFAQDSLVCLETSTGDNPGDWKPASQVGEIDEALSVGTGKLISSDYGGVGDLYALETGFSQASTPAYESASEQGYSYENLLNTIDGILKTGDGGPAGAPERKSSFNYDLMDKFDIRLSKIQEELEAARWEKNLLLEKMRMKDLEDRKQRDRIVELEGRLKAALGQGGALEKEFEQLRQSSGGAVPEAFGPQNGQSFGGGETASAVSPQSWTTPGRMTPPPASGSEWPAEVGQAGGGVTGHKSQVTGQKLHDSNEAPDFPAAEPKNIIKEKDSRILKNLRASGEVKLERLGDSDNAAQAENVITSGRLKSLGGSAKSLAGFGDISGETLSAAETLACRGPLAPSATETLACRGPVAPSATETLACRGPVAPSATENLEPLPQQAGGVVYDFTVVTSKSAEPFKKVQFNIEAQSHGAPAGGQRTAPEAVPAAGSPPHTASPDLPAPLKQPPPASAPDKTERIAISGNVLKAEVKSQVKPARKGGRLAFIAVIMIFGAIAAGGLGFFFLGDGLSFSEFSMLDFNSSKRAKKSVMPSQLEPQVKDKNAPPLSDSAEETAGIGKGIGKATANSSPTPLPQPLPAVGEQAPEKTTAPPDANEGVKTAIETVKNYKLSGGRGAIGGWFANSFLSGSSGAASEEWSATPLHGDILVVQYRLIRQKQDPLIYQFEVDGAKNDIIRGINNNAIELLDFSSGKTAQNAAPAPKPEGPAKKISAKELSAKAKPVRKPGKPRGVPILPLPDAPRAGPKNEDPTGFEDAQPENGEKVKYIRAQESDEELF